MDNGISKKFSDSIEYADYQIKKADEYILNLQKELESLSSEQAVKQVLNAIDASCSWSYQDSLSETHHYEPPCVGFKQAIYKAVWMILSFCSGGVFANIFFK